MSSETMYPKPPREEEYTSVVKYLEDVIEYHDSRMDYLQEEGYTIESGKFRITFAQFMGAKRALEVAERDERLNGNFED